MLGREVRVLSLQLRPPLARADRPRSAACLLQAIGSQARVLIEVEPELAARAAECLLQRAPVIVDPNAPVPDSIQGSTAAIALAARAHLLPEAYLGGLAYFFGTDTRATYLLGTRYTHGVWFYFPTVMLIKCTLGFLLLLGLAPYGLLRKRECGREVLWMLICSAISAVWLPMAPPVKLSRPAAISSRANIAPARRFVG